MTESRDVGRTAVFLMTHLWDDAIAQAAGRLARERPADMDLVVVVQSDDAALVERVRRARPDDDVIAVTTGDMLSLPFPNKVKGPKLRLNPGNVDLVDLVAAEKRPGYEHYWRIEYDVHLSGDWGRFFRHFEPSPSDLLTTTIRYLSDDPDWWFAKRFQWPGRIVADERRVIAFMPIARFSARAVQAVRRCYRDGLDGHQEMVWPTVVAEAGLTLEDLGGRGGFAAPANRGRYYFNTPGRHSLSPGTFVFRPAFVRVWDSPDTLWHPYKPGTMTSDWQRRGGHGAGRHALDRMKRLFWDAFVGAWVIRRRLGWRAGGRPPRGELPAR